MIFSTPGIVLKTVKYGDTSGIITIYTRLFGMQSYMVNGIRSPGKTSRSHLYQPASMLDMEVYHNPLKNLQRVKDARWKVVYQSIFTDVIKNAIAQFMVELFQKSILAEEQHEDLYTFLESEFIRLDVSPSDVAADHPVKFMAALPSFLGFEMVNNYSAATPFFDPKEGRFTGDEDGQQIERSSLVNLSLSQVLNSLKDDQALKLNGLARRALLHLMEKYYQYHVDGFTALKTLRVLDMLVR